MKLSRREIVAVVAGSAAAAKVAAQTPAVDLAKAAQESNRRNADLLAKVELPAATEPAFRFRA